MIVVVTGSAGFIGKSLCRRLTSLGYKVVGIDKKIKEQTELSIELQNYFPLVRDLRSPSWVNDFAHFGKPDLCIHLAALTSVDECEANRYEAYTNNVLSTYMVVEACRQENIPLIYASSVSVYGDKGGMETTETDFPEPSTYYATTKLIGEELVKTLPNWKILRFGTTYGPEMRSVVAPYIFLKSAIGETSFTIQGNGKQRRCFVYIDDIVDGCISMLDMIDSKNNIVNLAGTKSESILSLAKICWSVTHPDWENREELYYCKFYPPRLGDTMFENINIHKAEVYLGWTPKINLEAGIKKIYKTWKFRKI